MKEGCFEPLNWSLLSNNSVLSLVFDVLLDSLSLADLLSCSHQFLCGLIKLIRTCGSFHNLQALGVVEGIEASSQDLSTLYPAAWNTSQGRPGWPPSFLSGWQHNVEPTGWMQGRQTCRMADIWGNSGWKLSLLIERDFKLFHSWTSCH